MTDVDFFYCNFGPGPTFWAQWREVVVKTWWNYVPFWTSVLTPGYISWKIGFVIFFKWGIWRNWQSRFFYWGGEVGSTRYGALIFLTIVFFFVVVAKTYQSSSSAATATVLVREGPSLDPPPLCPGLLSDISPLIQGFWGRIPRLLSPQRGRLLDAISGHPHCVQY